jgi:hypothetical protein
MRAGDDANRSRLHSLKRLAVGDAEPILVLDFQRVLSAPTFGESLGAVDSGRTIYHVDPVDEPASGRHNRSLAELATRCADAFRQAEPAATAVTVVGYCSAAALSLRIAEQLAPSIAVQTILVLPTWPDSAMIESELARLRTNLGAEQTTLPGLSQDGVGILGRITELLDADLRAMIKARNLHAPSVLASGLLTRSVAWLAFLLACRADVATPWRDVSPPTVITGTDRDPSVPWLALAAVPLTTVDLPTETGEADRLLADLVLQATRPTVARPERLMVLLGGQYGSVPPAEIAACADGLADLHFLVDAAEADMFTVARALAPTSRADLSDRAACLDVLRRSGATAVTTFADQLCPLATWLNARLAGHADSEALWGHKDAQRRRLREAGLSTTLSQRVSDGAALRNFARSTGFPIVVKPTNGCGSHDVSLLRQETDIDELLARSGTGPRAELDSLFAEQLIVGENWAGRHRADYVSAEIFRPGSRDGTASLRFVTDRLPLARPFRETGLILPSVIAPEKQQAILATAENALDAVGATEGVFHVEMKTKSPVPEIIELNGRLGGFLARLVRYGTGQRLGRLALSCALGRAESPTLRWDRCALVLLFQAPLTAVAVTRAPTRREIRRMPGVVAVDDVSPAGTVVDWRHGTNRAVAWVWLTADGHDELHERVADVSAFLAGGFTFVDSGGRDVRDSEWLERVSGDLALGGAL